MHLTFRGARRLLAMAVLVVSVGSLVVVGANVPQVRDALAMIFAATLVALFFGIRLVAYRLREPGDREFEFWGGMAETMDGLLARYERPGGNPILSPDAPPGPPGLPDTSPSFHGHPVGDPGHTTVTQPASVG